MTAPPLRAPSGKKVRKKKPRNKPILEPDAQDTLQGSALIRALASPDNSTRKKGLDLLTSWLESHTDISEHDVARLWKALYFCFWHSDLITVQTALAERLAQLVVDLSPRVALSFFQGFVQTMKREWSGIDQHRMNKYLVLVRKFYAASLSRLEHAKWDPAVVSQFMSVLRDDVILMPTANDLGAGFAYFVCDIAVEEMVKAAEAAGAGKRRLAGETVLALLEPFVEGLVATKNKVLLMRLYSAVFSEVARHVDEQVTPFDSVDGVGFAEALFERGSCKETRATNRKYLYQASSELEQAGKRHPLKREKNGKSLAENGTAEVTPPAAKKTKAKTKEGKKEGKKEKAKEGKKKKKKRQSAEAFGSPLDADTAPEAGARAEGDTPASSGSKKKKKKTKEKAAVAASEEKREKREKKRGGKAGKGETPEVPPRRKSVRINLRKNLVVTIGEKPYPEAVRTPPTSKPRGSALKVKGDGPSSTKRKNAKPRSQRSLKM